MGDSPIVKEVVRRVALASGLGGVRYARMMAYRAFGEDPNRIIASTPLPLGRVLGLSAKGDVCVTRKLRTSALFAIGKAGFGRRLSPGQGGHYRRTEESKISC